MERQFILVNKKNEELSFNSSDIFGHTPEGLGMEIEGTTYQAYNSFNDMVLTVKQNEITLKLTLGNDSRKPYATYMYLLKFLNVGGLILRYIVPDVGTFERKIALRSLSKKDMDLYSVLQEEIKFAAMTPWYSWVTLSKNFDRVFNAGRIWDDSRIYQTKYAYSWSNTGLSGTETYAYAYDKTGTDRFTTVFPNLNLLPDSRLLSGNTSAFAAQSGSTISINSSIKGLNVSSNGASTSATQQGFGTSKQISASAEKVYTLSGYVKNTSPNGKAITKLAPQLGFYNSASTPLGYFNKVYNIPNDGKEYLVSFTYTAPSNTVLYKAWFLDITEFANETHSFTIRDMKVEEGDIVTPWMPTDSESLVTDFPMYLGKAYINNDEPTPTDPKSYVWIPSDLTGPVPPVVYRGDFTREFPRLNLFKNTKIQSWTSTGPTEHSSSNFYSFENIAANTLTITYDFEIKNSTGIWSGSIRPTYGLGGVNHKVSNDILKGSHKESITINGMQSAGAGIRLIGIPKDAIVIIRNLKVEIGSTATPWMPSISEVTQDDYPSYLGTYSGLGNPDLDDPLMYSWNRYNYTTGVDANIIPDPTFMTNPPLLSNTESKKVGDTWQVFNTGTNVGSVVTKTSDGLKLVNMGGNKLYLRPNQMLGLVSNNEYRLEYDITVSSVSSSNDMYIVFTNQSQLPNYADVVDPNNPYIKIPLTGEVTTNLSVDFNPISIRNVEANTKCRRIIDFTVPSGYNFGIIQAVNSNQSTTTYNNFDLSYPTETINEPADGPYSIISPKTNIYQIDYSRAASYLEIDNDSMYFGTQTDSSLRMVIKATPTTGRIDNPSWYLTDDAGNKIQTEGFLTGIPVGYELVVSSDPFERYMVLRDSSGNLPDTEIDQFIDPMVTGWIRVPVGISKLVLSDTLYSATGGFNAGSVSLEYKKEWVIV